MSNPIETFTRTWSYSCWSSV